MGQFRSLKGARRARSWKKIGQKFNFFLNFNFSNLTKMKHPMGRVFHSKNILSKLDIFDDIGYFYVANGRFQGKNR